MRINPYQHNRNNKMDYKHFLFLSYFPALTGLEFPFVTNKAKRQKSQKRVRNFFFFNFIKHSAYYKIFQINVVQPNQTPVSSN